MGVFSKKKKIFVSSVAYNLAGDQKDRVQYLPTTVVGTVLSGSNFSMGETINSSLLHGPGVRLRSFARWARTLGYTNLVGQTSSQLRIGANIDFALLATHLTKPEPGVVSIQTAEIGMADYAYWAEEWILANHPDLVDGDYELDFDEVANIIYIRFPLITYTLTPVGFDPLAQYLYVSYNIVGAGVDGPIVPGPQIEVDSPSQFPSTAGWQSNGTTGIADSMVLVTKVDTVDTYSDSRPATSGTSQSTSTVNFPTTTDEYEKTLYGGKAPGSNKTTSTRSIRKNTTTKKRVSTPVVVVTNTSIGGGVTKTTTTTTTTDTVVTSYVYQTDTQESDDKSWSPMHLLIYKQNSGDAVLDAMFTPSADAGIFFPFIPIRQNNRMLSDNYHGNVFARNPKALKKATGAKYADLVKNIASTPSLKDIDHAYAVFGVALNTQEKAAKKYLYKFFQAVYALGAGGTGEYNSWKAAWNVANTSKLAWKDWFEAQSVPASPLYGLPEPKITPYPPVPNRSISVRSSRFNYYMTVSWNAMAETVFTGLGKPTAKVGDVWLTAGATANYFELLHSAGILGSRSSTGNLTTITWQDEPDSYRVMAIWGLRHDNIVYKGKGVGIGAHKALADNDESGFIVPLHEGVFRELSIKDATQMSTACTYLVFNCYTVVKQKWYQTGLFKIVVIGLIIVVSIFFPPAGGVGAGLLGTAAAVGASLGLVGLTAVIVGAIANALAAMLLSMLIMKTSTALFGDKIGAIVGTIASIAAVAYGTSLSSGQGFAASYGDMMSAQNIMKLSIAAGDGYTGYLKAENQDIIDKSLKLMEEYSEKSKEISNMYAQNIGFKGATFDPMLLTESAKLYPETPSMFLSRTLLTGSDISGMTNDMIGNFVAVTTSTQLT